MIGLVVSGVVGFLALFADFDIQPRTGDYFVSTRVPFEQSYGMRFYDLGYAWARTVVAPVVLCPTGLALATVDKFVLSPVWDTLCLPYDAIKNHEREAGDGPPSYIPSIPNSRHPTPGGPDF